jgi:hypothetical protein
VTQNIVCWHCGVSVREEPLPLSTYAECRPCRAQLHCCRQCQHYNPRLRVDCDEPRAESHSEREKANFCDWFKLRREFVEPGEKAPSADHQTELDTLFGTDAGVSQTPSDSRTQLDDLFTTSADDP